MINTKDILETINMIDNENLDVRTITMGISLLSCADSDADRAAAKDYEKITRTAEKLVETGEFIEKTYGIPIINKRISVTPAAMLAASSGEPLKYARVMDRAARELGVNFIGGYSALVQKGFSAGDRELIESIPEALSETERVCSSVNVGSTKAGINMDAVAMMGRVLQRPGGQSLHGGRLPRPRRAGLRDKRGRFGPRRGTGCGVEMPRRRPRRHSRHH